MSFFESIKKGKSAPLVAPTSTTANPTSTVNTPWVEKYRPKKIADVIYQEEVVSVLRNAIVKNELPHLLFYGPAGTGKTSTILAACREMYGADNIKARVLELNASDDRGIAAVRAKVKTFAQGSIATDAMGPNNRKMPPYKIIILDECDALTTEAQSALRRIIEIYSSVTRFCLICNYLTRIIEPIASRCAKFRFKPIDSAVILKHLSNICIYENMKFGNATRQDEDYKVECLDHLISISNGDLRRAINLLQSCQSWEQQSITSNHSNDQLLGDMDSDILDSDGPVLNYPPAIITSLEEIQELSGVIPDTIVYAFLNQFKKLAQVIPSKAVPTITSAVKSFIYLGYPVYTLISQLTDLLINDQLSQVSTITLTDFKMAVIFEKLSLIDERLVDGADEEIQLMDLAFSIYAAYKD